ncbi:MAG: M43 family zinc metalloprotease [Crocinitomicaceae bacterium]
MKKLYFSLAAVVLTSLCFSQVVSPKEKTINSPSKTINATLNSSRSNNSGQVSKDLSVTLTNNNQLVDGQPFHECKSHELTKAHYEERGEWNAFHQDYLNGTQQAQNQNTQNKTPGTNTIAIIFHVVHEGEAVGTGTNVSNAAIMAVYNDLVEDFSLTNADQTNARTGLGFIPADPGIDFCLATQDPFGVQLSETGVTRIQTTETWFDPDDPNEVNAMKSAPLGSPIWDRDDYLNVWICDISNGAGSGTAGYAYRPTTTYLPSSSIDGIVIDYNLGVNNDNILTHEVGHYLGLDHTWGGSGSCTSDDGFTDTPNTAGPSFNYGGSCSGTQQTCSGIETQYENYMDYSNCTVMFTTEQSNYMNTILSGIRSSLLLSSGCDPAGPPVCSFTSSPTGPSPVIISEGGTVVFNDESTGAPTSWAWTISGTQGTDWDFTGGTSATSENPEVTFYNAGTYDVSLIASNAFGSCSGANEIGYVDVVTPATGTACDTLRNYALSEAIAWYNSGGSWGYLGGHGEIFAGYPIDEWAEPYTATTTAEVRRIIVPFALVEDVSGTGSINFHVRADNAGTPGGILATETVLLADLNDFAYNTIDFTTPASVTGDFWVGMEIFYGSPQDTVVVYAANIGDRPGGVGTTQMREATDWYQTDDYYPAPGLNLSLAWDVLLSNGPDPVADFQFSEAAVCPGGDIVVNASGSQNVTDYEWFQTDDPFTTIIDDNFTAGTTFNFAGPSGDYQIFLFTEGSCRTDALVLPVTVYPAVNASVNVTHTTCGENNGSVTITGATGGEGTYEYSLNGSTFQSSNTYSSLPSGNYTAYVRTSGDACLATIPFTINASTPLSGSATSSVSICVGDNTNITASGGTGYTWYDGSTVIGTTATVNVSPAVSTQYSVEITDGTCTDIQFSNVNVDPLDDASFDFFDFCAGATNQATNIATAGGTFSLLVNPDGATIDPTTGEISNETVGTTYTVEYSVAANCPNSSTEDVTVNSNDDPSFSTGDFCEGSTNSVTSIATPGGTFTYDGTDASSISASTGVITGGVVGTTYNITYTTPVGVCQSVSAPVAVTVINTPTVGAGTNQTVCEGQTVTLTATNPDGAAISWDNGISDGVAFTPSVGATTYTVTANISGCTDTDQVDVVTNITPTVGAGTDQSVCEGDQVTLSASNPDGATITWDNGITDGAAFTPAIGTTTYTVTADLGSCSSSDQVDVEVNVLPTVNAGSDTTICEGETITLTADNPDAGTLSWTNGVVDGSPFTPGSGSVTYTVTSTLGSCSTNDQVVVTVNPSPSVSEVITHDDGSSNGAIDITVSGGSGFTISWDNGETTEDISNLPAGDYTVTITNSFGCETVATFTVLSTVGIDEEADSDLSIYPNPTDGIFTVQLEGSFDLKIMDARGRLIVQQLYADNAVINLSDYESGVYFIQVRKDGEVMIRKIVKQ